MSLMTEGEMLLANLKGDMNSYSQFFMAKEEAYARLKQKFGQDFGFDAEKWRQWLEENTAEIIDPDD